MDVLDVAVALLVLAVLVSAAVSDWRKREASDIHWIVMAGAGAVLLAYRLFDAGYALQAVTAAVSIVLMTVDLVWDRESASADLALYVSIAVSVILTAFLLIDSDHLWEYVSMPVMYMLMNALYYTGIVKGGADAKAVIVLAFVMPLYPDLGILPFVAVPAGNVSQLIVPAFSVFFIAAVLTILAAVPYLIINLMRGDREFPYMLAGYRMDLEKVPGSHVWPMEDMCGGMEVRSLSGFDDPGTVDRLREFGRDRVWVTPIIPFLVPMVVSYAIVVFLGNPLFAFI